jgi:hypothetical protein
MAQVCLINIGSVNEELFFERLRNKEVKKGVAEGVTSPHIIFGLRH